MGNDRASPRRLATDWGPLVVVTVVNTVMSLSSEVGRWASEADPATTRLPSLADPILSSRPDVADADIHVILWCLTGVALAWALRCATWRRLAAGACAVFSYSAVVELAQHLTTSRSAQWIDVAGNAVGVIVGAVAMRGAIIVRHRLSTPHTTSAAAACTHVAD